MISARVFISIISIVRTFDKSQIDLFLFGATNLENIQHIASIENLFGCDHIRQSLSGHVLQHIVVMVYALKRKHFGRFDIRKADA
jgi:hypothetical protein